MMMDTPKFSQGRNLMEPRSILLVSLCLSPSVALRSTKKGPTKKRRSGADAGFPYRQYRDDGDETPGPYFTLDSSLRPAASSYTRSIESALEKIRVLEAETEAKDGRILELERELSGSRKEVLKLLGTLETYQTSTSDLRETVTLKDEQLQSAKTLTEKHQSEVSKLNRQLRETLAEFTSRFSVIEEERDRALKSVRELEETLKPVELKIEEQDEILMRGGDEGSSQTGAARAGQTINEILFEHRQQMVAYLSRLQPLFEKDFILKRLKEGETHRNSTRLPPAEHVPNTPAKEMDDEPRQRPPSQRAASAAANEKMRTLRRAGKI